MRVLPAVVVLCLNIGFAPADDRDKSLDRIAGYTRQTLDGFTLMVSDHVSNASVKRYELKPMDVLKKELDLIVAIMSATQLETLRKLVVWVEWDELETVENGRDGRDGSVVAVYYGGHQSALLKEGKQPLKAKTVTILQMKLLTELHQPKNQPELCLLLHEFSHAVHDQLLGRKHAGISAAYAQAMERKLYDKAQYISTNEAEFFAEATCAYFNQLHYYPKTRDELKSHDPATFKLLETIWGAGKHTETDGRKPATSEVVKKPEFDLRVTPKDVVFELPVHGPKLTPRSLIGHACVVGFFGRDDLPVLDKLNAIHDELAPYGTVVLTGAGQSWDASDLLTQLAARKLSCTVMAKLMLRDGPHATTASGQKPSHTLVFDAKGQCVFRGSGHEAAPVVRTVVGRELLAKLGTGSRPKELQPVADALVSGQPILKVLPALSRAALSDDNAVSQPATALLDVLTAPGKANFEEAKAIGKRDQVAAFLLLEPAYEKYRGSPIGDRISAALEGLRGTVAVTAELKARIALEPILKLDAGLRARAGGFNPSDAQFRARHRAAIGQLKTAIDLMKRQHPKAQATEQAEKVWQAYESP